MLTLNDIIAFMSITTIFLSIVCVYAFIGIGRRDKTILDLRTELVREKEKLRLLNLLNPEPRFEDGWTFEYTPSTRFIGKSHKNGKGKMSICEIKTQEGWNLFADYYGYRIAKLLNDGYITSSPEPGRNMEVVYKNELPKSLSITDAIESREILEDEILIRKKEIKEHNISLGYFIEGAKEVETISVDYGSEVKIIEIDTPMPPVKTRRTVKDER